MYDPYMVTDDRYDRYNRYMTVTRPLHDRYTGPPPRPAGTVNAAPFQPLDHAFWLLPVAPALPSAT